MDSDAAYKQIKAYFDEKDKALARQGKLPLGSTELGYWGTTHLDDSYELFKSIELEKEKSFVDLGSGDGRIVFVAALFTSAVGVEYDEKLHAQALEALRALSALELPVKFLRADYTRIDLSAYPVWFSYADHNFEWLERKEHELTKLYLYHDTFHPHFLAKGKTIWIGQIPVFVYTRKTN